jgi:hypothetical protein
MLHRNSLYHGEVLDVSALIIIILQSGTTQTRLFKMGILQFAQRNIKQN